MKKALKEKLEKVAKNKNYALLVRNKAEYLLWKMKQEELKGK